MKKYFIATVQIAVLAEDDSEACDAISECLTNNLQYAGAILDWRYSPMDTNNPKPSGEIDEATYEEGEAFTN